MARAAFVFLIAVAIGAAAPLAQAQPAPPPEESALDTLKPTDASPDPTGESWWREMVRRMPDCRTFSDGCRVCTRDGGGFACSNIAIACQPQEWACRKD
jgi:hypothetical protein